MDEISQVADLLEKENDRRAAADPNVKAALEVVLHFLREHEVLCYGGTAINNLLPAEDRFYNPEYVVPDFDFFSKTPQEHAMLIANRLAEIGIKSVEVRPGMHLGTFKVFADYEGVADVTHLNHDIFDRLWKEGVEKGGVHYVTPNFLRMSMYLELSRPQGDVSRWTKVFSRLVLLNKHYPIVCKDVPKEPTLLDDKNRKRVEHILTHSNVVLLGLAATQLHEKKRKIAWSAPVTILAEPDVAKKIVEGYKVKEVKGTEILPSYQDVYDEDGNLFLRIHETAACHSYHHVGTTLRVASIPTLLQFFFSYMYSGIEEEEINHLVCVAQRLMDIAHSKPKRRYALLTPVECLGRQDSIVDIRKHKAVLYEQLSKNKASAEFLKYFFTYNPRVSVTKRAQIREQLKKTRKQRYESSY